MQFKHILFAVDFSAPCRAMTAEVEWLANRFQAAVTLMHVVEIPALWYAGVESGIGITGSIGDFVEAAAKRLAEMQIAVPAERVRREVRQGDAALELERYMSDQCVDLVVLGTHGHGPVRSMLCGSVMGKLLHDSDCPIWTAAFVNGESRCHPVVSKILCAIELTGEAVPLLRDVQALASDFNAQVRIVHAINGAETRPNKYFDFDLHRFLAEAARVEIGKVQRIAGTDFPVSIGDGSISKTIGALAVEYGSDLVVIGRGHSQGTLGQLRTHAYQIIREVPCPVLSCLVSSDRISSSCSEAHLVQSEADARLQTGYLMTSTTHPL